MRHLTAVHVEAHDGEPAGWRYATLGRRGGGPLACCADHAHETEQLARECRSAWLRERVTVDGTCAWTTCDVGRNPYHRDDEPCPNPAKQLARIEGDGWHVAALCDHHATVEHAVRAMGLDQPAGDSWQS